MGLILKHEKNKYQGDGFLSALTSLIPKAASFIANNKNIISSGAKAVSSIGQAASDISKTVKQSKELEELQRIRELRNKRLEQKLKTGNGFKILG